MGIRRVLERFAVAFEIERPPPIVRERGRVRDAGASEIFEGRGGIQPASPEDLQRVPEGQRDNAAIVIYPVDCELRTAEPPDQRADRVTPKSGDYCGIKFEIQSLEAWPNHRKYIATRLGQ
jgi:hypothetical protein